MIDFALQSINHISVGLVIHSCIHNFAKTSPSVSFQRLGECEAVDLSSSPDRQPYPALSVLSTCALVLNAACGRHLGPHGSQAAGECATAGAFFRAAGRWILHADAFLLPANARTALLWHVIGSSILPCSGTWGERAGFLRAARRPPSPRVEHFGGASVQQQCRTADPYGVTLSVWHCSHRGG